MKQFKEGQIVKSTQDAPYVTAGEIAEVKMSLISLDLILVFHEGIDDESAFPCKQANPEHFDFYEKVRYD